MAGSAATAAKLAKHAVKAVDKAQALRKVTKAVENTHDYAKTIDKAWDAAGPTRSSLRKGQRIHKSYRANQVLDGITAKEYYLDSANRVDFIDFEKKIVYEAKPNNPRGIASGNSQLARYLNRLGEMWRGILDLY